MDRSTYTVPSDAEAPSVLRSFDPCAEQALHREPPTGSLYTSEMLRPVLHRFLHYAVTRRGQFEERALLPAPMFPSTYTIFIPLFKKSVQNNEECENRKRWRPMTSVVKLHCQPPLGDIASRSQHHWPS
jgi:hypothetical protein